jgi:dTDP-4-dehydrorhamnose 3,5-epimerase
VSFRFKRLSIPDVIHIETDVHKDARGYFAEMYRSEDFKSNGIPGSFVQLSTSRSSKHVIRGLHYQTLPKAQGKLITVLHGSIFDVAVDIRAGSRTFGNWVGMELNAESKDMVYIPQGFAHGFCALSDTADVLYNLTDYYSPEYEKGIRWDDPQINIKWPVPNTEISLKDRSLPLLAFAENNFIYTN